MNGAHPTEGFLSPTNQQFGALPQIRTETFAVSKTVPSASWGSGAKLVPLCLYLYALSAGSASMYRGSYLFRIQMSVFMWLSDAGCRIRTYAPTVEVVLYL